MSAKTLDRKGRWRNKTVAFRVSPEEDEQAKDMFLRLVKEYAQRQGVTEQLKTDDQMLWVCKMNAIRNAAMEVVNKELIFA